jgi:hypothetical protein
MNKTIQAKVFCGLLIAFCMLSVIAVIESNKTQVEKDAIIQEYKNGLRQEGIQSLKLYGKYVVEKKEII